MKNFLNQLKPTARKLAYLMVIPMMAFMVSCNDDDGDDDMDPDDPTQTIVEIAQETEGLGTLVSALSNYSDILEALNSEGTYTVFAPTNDAMTTLLGALGYEGLDDVPEDALRSILEYHVIAGEKLMSTDLFNGQMAETLLEGESITVSINGSTVMINMSTVVTADVEATNGVVHVIDAVLVPSFIETRSIAEIAGDTENLSVLATAVGNYEDIAAALSDPSGTYTVFAPTDDAFADLLEILGYATLEDVPSDLLEEVLMYHVIAGSALQSTDLSDGQEANTLLEGESITVTIDGTTVMINTSTVIAANVNATNGVVHIIDEVLVPSYVPTSDIVDLASGAENLSVLVQALTKFPDLVETLSDNSGEFTVFAPTDEAFLALLGVIGQESLDDIPESVIRRILEYHVVPSVAYSSDLTDAQSINTVLMDESVTVSLGSEVMINESTVTTPDIGAVNGVVHIIDAVLVPSLEASIVNTVVEPAYFNVNFTTLTAAVVQADLLSTLIDPMATYTVFAPTNDAFEAAGITSLDGLTAEDLSPILLYHVLDFEADAAAVGALGTGSAVPSLGGNSYLSINDDGIFLNGTSQVIATDIDADNGIVHVIDRTLMPPSSNVVEIAVAASEASEGAEFTQLVAALTAVSNGTQSDLVTTLSGTGPFTVFAPTDAAFEALYAEIGDDNQDGSVDINDLVSAVGLETIATVLQYHVYGGRVFSTDIPNVLDGNASVSISAVAGGSWTLNSDLTITAEDAALSVGLDDAAIVDTDIMGTNGVIHVIDQVILP